MKIFLGPPGTGKTTRLLRVVEEELARGVHPGEIAFVAFTRKAAHEARTRAMAKFNLQEEQLPYFRTLHSLAFKQLKLEPEQVLADKDFNEIGQSIGMTIGDLYGEDEDTGLPTSPTMQPDRKGNNCVYLDQIARLTCRDLKECCTEYALERYWDVKLFRDTLTNFKAQRGKIDFTDMMELYSQSGDIPNCKVVIVDEAQDLTPIQWRIVERITNRAERVYVAGDDDQAIYEWAGADVSRFLSLDGTREVLPVSYRLTHRVYDKARGVLNRIKQRYEKDWEPRNELGYIGYYNEPDQVDYSEGTWLLLCRNRYMLAPLCAVMKRQGYPYVMHGKSSVDNDNVRALVAWESLRLGNQVKYEDAKTVVRKLRPGALPGGVKALSTLDDELISLASLESIGLTTREDWMTALKIPDASREYYRAMRRHKESFIKWPRIVISTIHQAKGGEADHVVVMPDISEACYRGMQRNSDVEGRVFYVAVTRAIKSLHLIQPRTFKYYELRGTA